MADEFQTGICSGNWWNSARNGSNEASLPCSSVISDVGSFGWPSEMMEMKARSCEDSVSVTDSSIVYQDAQKSQGSDSISGGGSGILMDSTLQMMSYGLASPTMDWNQALLSRNGGRAESNFLSMLQEDLSSKPNYEQETGLESADIQKVWSPKRIAGGSGGGNLSSNVFKRINQEFTFDQHRLNPSNSSGDCAVICHGLPTSFSMDSVSYGYPSTLLQGLLEPEFQPQQSSYENRTMNYPSQSNYTNTNELSPPWPKIPQFLNSLSTPNKSPFWNPSSASMNNVRPSLFPSSQTRHLTSSFEEKPNCSSNLAVKPKTEEVRDSGSLVKKGSSEPALKRPRIETPSPLPTFKVRKEKLGDRITALQQLVSPFGKTDTASVLFEAIGYIKFLHEQVSALSAPYMKNGAPIQQQQNSEKSKGAEGPQQDLRSRGLCLVPISSTFAVTNEITTDYWMPTFGGTYR